MACHFFFYCYCFKPQSTWCVGSLSTQKSLNIHRIYTFTLLWWKEPSLIWLLKLYLALRSLHFFKGPRGILFCFKLHIWVLRYTCWWSHYLFIMTYWLLVVDPTIVLALPIDEPHKIYRPTHWCDLLVNKANIIGLNVKHAFVRAGHRHKETHIINMCIQ